VAEPFLSEIRIMSFGFPPKGWAMCNGQLLPINQNQALFSLLGTTFGGDGRVNFALPNLQGRTPIHVGPGFTLGNSAGEQAHTTTIGELPTHAHALQASNSNADAPVPFSNNQGNVVAASPSALYDPSSHPLTTMNTGSVTNAGGNQPHLNMQPFLALNFCIALQGIFPSPN
jgi:microcystin-dependent protein